MLFWKNLQDDDKSNDLDGRSFSSSEDDEMAQIVDLSSLVKVEIREGYSQALSDATTQRSAGATSRSPTTPTSSPRHSISTPISPPPQFGIQGDLFPHLFGKDAPNMFHFGDVKVNHHLETQSTPMVIPMVYLYPILDENQGKYFCSGTFVCGKAVERSHMVGQTSCYFNSNPPTLRYFFIDHGKNSSSDVVYQYFYLF